MAYSAHSGIILLVLTQYRLYSISSGHRDLRAPTRDGFKPVLEYVEK